MRRNSKSRGDRERRRPHEIPASRHPLRAAAQAGHAATPGSRSGGAAEAWLTDRGEDGSFDASRLIRHADWRALVPDLERLGCDPAILLPRLAGYIARVLAWNRTASNLVSRADEGRLVSRHLRESLEPGAWIAAAGAGSCLDFGSGAGFPALPLALAGVGEHWRLVESRRPKVLFLRKVIQELRVERVVPTHSRLERLTGSDPTAQDDNYDDANALLVNTIDVFTSRATLRLAETLALAEKVVRPGGAAFLWKGSRRTEELELLRAGDSRWALAGETPLSGSNVSLLKLILQN